MVPTTLLSSYLVPLVLMVATSNQNMAAQALPTASVGLYSSSNKFGGSATNKLMGDDTAEQSFRDFIHSKSPDSTVIGEIKPNASALEIMLLRNKIADTISSMQEMEKQSQVNNPQPPYSNTEFISGADCYIEVTRIEKVPGKCHRVGGGLPVCQSDNYMAISSDCN